nr:AlpA family phage regulatory protein [uncultured Brevundimonas sp.]
MDELKDRTASPGGLEDRILPWSQVKVISGLSRTTVWRLQKTGDFPASVQVSPNRVGWWQSELLEWKRARTPRRLPKPQFVPTANRPDPPPPKKGLAPACTPPPGPPTAPQPARGRRKDPSPNQIAFDFGP